ncbi:hypothetical protein [Pedobacter gandavensis]|uniref:hypothetical protein n=1 Tax=Pedobacter gandavensis TaxID=2679963 RepID=UPI00292F5559|nr:hypothetical protein [Pedobacter gandavensis]
MKISGFLLLICSLNIISVHAQNQQEINTDFIQLYKENAELSYISPRGEIGSPYKYVINGRLTTTYMLLATEKLPIAFAVVPDFTVRVLEQRSAAVRTPSFRLGGTLFVRLDRSVPDYKYATLTYTHHSNGQDGEALNPDGSINTTNGNFTTNALTLSYHFGTDLNKNTNAGYYSLNHEIGFEWHKWFNYEKALTHDYGFSRFLYNFSWRSYQPEKEQWRLNLEVNYAVNPMTEYELFALKKRLNAELSYHYSFPFMNNAYLMVAAGYYGEDPYNIYYRNKYSYIRLGISSGILRGKK